MSYDDTEALPVDGIIVETYRPLEQHEAATLRTDFARWHEDRHIRHLVTFANLARLERLWHIEARVQGPHR